MAVFKRIIAFLAPLLLVLSIAIAGYGYSQVRKLSLPIPEALAILTLLLPVITGISAEAINRLLRIQTPQTRPTLLLLAILAFQIICDTIIATLSLVHLIPGSALNCGLETRWTQLYRSKDEGAIRRIQDTFHCCGLNSPVDRPWPFPRGGPSDPNRIGADQCQRLTGINTSCMGPWRQAEQMSAGLFLTVALVIFLTKILAITSILGTSSWTQSPGWIRTFKQLTIGADAENGVDSRATMRGLIDDSNPSDNRTIEEYHDEEDTPSAAPTQPLTNGTGGPRVEPSGLDDGHDGAQWREEGQAPR